MKNRFCILFVVLFMVLQIGGQNSEITITLPDRIAIKVCKEFKVRVRSKTIIGKLSQIKRGTYDGVYSFRLSFQPHYPTKLFVINGGEVHVFQNLGFENSVNVINEVCSYLSDNNCNRRFIEMALIGLYKYVYGEYGLDYGTNVYYKYIPDFNNDSEKNTFILSRVKNIKNIEEEALQLSNERNLLSHAIVDYIKKEKMNSEEAIILLKYVIDGTGVKNIDTPKADTSSGRLWTKKVN
jgi:hypothetical protein